MRKEKADIELALIRILGQEYKNLSEGQGEYAGIIEYANESKPRPSE